MIRGISRLAEVFLEDFAPWIWVVVNQSYSVYHNCRYCQFTTRATDVFSCLLMLKIFTFRIR